MGSYTEFKFKAKLKKDTPDEVISVLKKVLIDRDLGHDKVMFHTEDVFKPIVQHPFFKCERWYMLFLSTNWDDQMQGGKMYEENGCWVLDIHAEFKNYDNEVDLFFDWIKPHIVGRRKKKYVGYWRHEHMHPQVNLYVEQQILNQV